MIQLSFFFSSAEWLTVGILSMCKSQSAPAYSMSALGRCNSALIRSFPDYKRLQTVLVRSSHLFKFLDVLDIKLIPVYV